MPTATMQNQEATGVPLIKCAPIVIPIGEGITREVAEAAYKRASEEVGLGKHPYLNVIAPTNGKPMRGSNPFIRYAIAPYVEREGGNEYRLITPAISEKAIAVALLYVANGDDRFLKKLSEFYEDPGLVAFEAEGPNEQLKQNLIDQLRVRGTVEYPVLFHRLKTVKDDKFDKSGGLRFELADDENVDYHAPILLNQISNFSSDDPSLVMDGLPSRLGEGDRTLYLPTKKTGLRKLFRDGDLDLNASYGYLLGSNEAGRVSFLVGTAPQNLELERRVQGAIRLLQGSRAADNF